MRKMKLAFLILTLSLVVAVAVYAEHPKTQQSADHAAMNSRGDQAMGFSHEKTTHHFRLFKDGGAIEVAANDPKNTDSRDMIRIHLAHIAKMFADGDFNTPMFIHDTTPPGATTMKELHEQIHYRYHDTESGGIVRIETANAKALDAVHSILRFQIAEHKIGDSSEIGAEAASSR